MFKRMWRTMGLVFCLAISAGCAGMFEPQAVQDRYTVYTLVAVDTAQMSSADAQRGLEIVNDVEDVLLTSTEANGVPDWKAAKIILQDRVSPVRRALAMMLLSTMRSHIKPFLPEAQIDKVKDYIRAAAEGARRGLTVAAQGEAS